MANVESVVRNFNKYICGLVGGGCYSFENKDLATRTHITYMLIRTKSMFKYNGLPDTIPERSLELMLQTNGNVCFAKHNEKLYTFCGGLGGEPDVYYMPTIYTVANPALKLSKNYKISKDCVVMPNDSLYVGLLPLFSRYAALMAETELSIKLALINARIVDLISAPDDATKASAEKFLQDISDGKQGVIASNEFLDGVKAQPYGKTGYTGLTDLIETEQYCKASWFNELGLNANYNMKRESLNSSESQLNDDGLLPLIDDMLDCRKKALEKVNEMFGTNITVDFGSAWKDNEIETELEQQAISGRPENEPEKGGEENEGGTKETE